jgi:hypothetical protein
LRPFFVMGCFSWTICPGWLGTVIFLISAFWVAGITGLSHYLWQSLQLEGTGLQRGGEGTTRLLGLVCTSSVRISSQGSEHRSGGWRTGSILPAQAASHTCT